MGKRKQSRHRPDERLALPTENDDRYPITGASPPAYMIRFVGGVSRYESDERPLTVGVMRYVGLTVALACLLLTGVGFLLM